MKAFDTVEAKEFFELPLQHWDYKWTRYITEEGIWNFLRSISFINRLPADEKEKLKIHVEEYIAKADKEGKVTRNEEGLIEIPCKVDTRWIRRK
jgi:hypothetical protein